MLDALDFLRRDESADTFGLRAPLASCTVSEGLLRPNCSHALSPGASARATSAKLLLALLVTLQKYGAGSLLRVRGQVTGAVASLLLDDAALLGDLDEKLGALLASRDGAYAVLIDAEAGGAQAARDGVTTAAAPLFFFVALESGNAAGGDNRAAAQGEANVPRLRFDADNLALEIEYASGAFQHPYMQWFGRCYTNVCGQILRANAVRVGDVRLQSEAQTAELIDTFGHAAPSYANTGVPHWYVDRHARLTPEHCAVVYDGQRSSYRELAEHSNRIAQRLTALRGAEREPPSVLALLRPDGLLAAFILGVLKARCIYVPLDADTPPRRIRHIMDDCRPAIVVADAETLRMIGSDLFSPARIISVGELLAGERDRSPPDAPVLADDTAYIIYTSGSTGLPKGVPITHGTLCNHMLAWEQMLPAPRPAELSGVLASSPGFDVSLWEFFYILWQGGTLHVLDPRVRKDPKALARYISENDLTTACIRPAMLDGIVQEFERTGMRFPLRQLFSGAESVSTATCERFKRLNPDLEIIIGYGTTETTIGATIGYYSETDGQAQIPIGRPLPGYRIYLVDGDENLVPLGATGEIIIGGPVLSPGYLNRPELTAQSFVADRFHPSAGSLMYKTGDLGRFLPDGNLVFCGRKDDQIKIHGVRVEPEEVAAVLKAVSGASNVAVTVHGEGTGRHLVAYLEQPRKSRDAIRAVAETMLPKAMLPAALVMLDKLPLNASTKIDRQKLPQPRDEDYASEDYVAPAGELEGRLAQIACKLLRIGRLGATDDLQRFGFNSLLILTYVDTVNKEFSAGLSLEDFRERPTIRRLAERLERSASCGQLKA